MLSRHHTTRSWGYMCQKLIFSKNLIVVLKWQFWSSFGEYIVMELKGLKNEIFIIFKFHFFPGLSIQFSNIQMINSKLCSAKNSSEEGSSQIL